jgi:hypothetical protein
MADEERETSLRSTKSSADGWDAVVADVGTDSFSVRHHFESLYLEQGEGRSCLFYSKSLWRRRWETLMVIIVHVNVVVIPFFITFASNSALGIANRPRMIPEQLVHRKYMQDVLTV